MHLSARARAIRSSEIRDLLRLADRPGVISLAGGLPDPASFPAEALAEAAADVLRRDPVPALQYSTTEGAPELRAWIARRHAAATGRATSRDQVLVTTGSQQGLDLLGRVLADPGDRAVAEEPGYLGALQALRAAGLDLVGAPVDEQGLDVDHLAASLEAGLRPRLVYTVPTFQNPTGRTLVEPRRRQLAELAERHDLVVVEDAPYAALSFGAAVPPPVAAFGDRVVSLGTFSKTLAPGLRLGWLVGPEQVVAAAVRAKQSVDLHTSGLSQQLARRMVADEDGFDRHVAQVSAIYARRAAALRTALLATIGDRYEISEPAGGMFLWASPRPGTAPHIDTRDLLPVAVEHGTAFVPGAAFAVGTPDSRLAASMRLSFATHEPAELADAAARLAAAIAATVAAV